MNKTKISAALMATAVLGATAIPIHSQELLAVDFGSAGPETGFVQQNSTSTTHTTSAGDVTVTISGAAGLFDFATAGSNDDFYRDFYYQNSGTITMTIFGPGISNSSNYDLAFWSYYGAEGRKTTFSPSPASGTSGPSLGPISDGFSPAPASLADPLYFTEGTYTSNGSGVLTIAVGSTSNRPAINGVRITAAGSDTTPPTLAPGDIVDNQSGGPALQGNPITYTITFSEDMDDTTVDATDFGDENGDVSFTVGTITETSPVVFAVPVTATSTGTLELQINPSSIIKDAAGNDLVTTSAIVDDTSITVDPPDTTDPTLASSAIVDNQSGGPVNQNSLITYTVTFSEDIDESTVDASDFGDAGGDVSISVGTITEASPGVFTVPVTPTTPGTLELQINASAIIEDPSGNDLDTSSAITDDTSITINASTSVTILAVDFNNGSSPTETGFIGQNSSGVTHTTTAGDITVSYSGQQGTFDRGASGGTNNDLYRDFIFDNNGGSPDMTITLTGPGITASTNYTLTFYAYDSGDATRRTGISGINSTTGTTLGPVISQATGVPDTLDEYAVTGTFTSDPGGNLTFGIDGLPNGNERTVINGFQLVGQISGGGGDFSDWQTANSTAGGIDDDHDLDGVMNGVEYFLGGANDTTGLTALPGVDDSSSPPSVTWTKASDYPGTYDSHFVVQTSTTLAPGSWDIATVGTGPGTVEITGDNVKYTFPNTGTKNFARLKVTGP